MNLLNWKMMMLLVGAEHLKNIKNTYLCAFFCIFILVLYTRVEYLRVVLDVNLNLRLF